MKTDKRKNRPEDEQYGPELSKPIDPKRVLQILEYRRRTMEFVESMLEPSISLDQLKSGEELICKLDYDGIVQERWLQRLCGYPLCSKEITKEWKQKYHVSFRDKKIYDVEVRKLYCSVRCMNSSNRYKEDNIPMEPIWMRPHEAQQDLNCGILMSNQ